MFNKKLEKRLDRLEEKVDCEINYLLTMMKILKYCDKGEHDFYPHGAASALMNTIFADKCNRCGALREQEKRRKVKDEGKNNGWQSPNNPPKDNGRIIVMKSGSVSNGFYQDGTGYMVYNDISGKDEVGEIDYWMLFPEIPRD